MTRLYSFLRSGLTEILLSASERDGKARFLAATEQSLALNFFEDRVGADQEARCQDLSLTRWTLAEV